MANPANPREFEADFESRGGNIERATEQLKGMGDAAARITQQVNRVGTDFAEVARSSIKFKEALTKAGEHLAAGNKDYQKLLEEEKKLNEKKNAYIKFLDAMNINNEEMSRTDKELLKSKKKELDAMNKNLATIEGQKTSMKINEAAGLTEHGAGGIGGMFEKMGTAMKTAIVGMVAEAGAQIGKYVLNKLDDFKEKTWNYNNELREGAKITGNIYSTGDIRASAGTQDEMMVKLTHGLTEKSNILKYFGMGKDAVGSIDTYMRAYKDRSDLKGVMLEKGEGSPEELQKKFEHLGTVAVATGLGFKRTMEEITSASRKYNIAETESTNLLVWATNEEKKKGLAEGELINNYKSLQSSLASFGFNIYQSAGMADKFGKALQEGRIGLGDIVNYAKGLQGAGAGEIYVLMQEGAKKGGKAGNLMKDAISYYGNDPLALEEWAKSAFQGDKKALGQFASAKGVSLNDLRASFYDVIKGMLPAGKAGDEFSERAIYRKAADIFKMDQISLNVEEARKMEAAKFRIYGTAPGASITEGIVPQDALSKIAAKMGDEIGTWEKIDTNISKLVGYAAEWANSFRTEHFASEYSDRAEAMIKQGDISQLESLSKTARSKLSDREKAEFEVGMLNKIGSNAALRGEAISGTAKGNAIMTNIFNTFSKPQLISVFQEMEAADKSGKLQDWLSNHTTGLQNNAADRQIKAKSATDSAPISRHGFNN